MVRGLVFSPLTVGLVPDQSPPRASASASGTRRRGVRGADFCGGGKSEVTAGVGACEEGDSGRKREGWLKVARRMTKERPKENWGQKKIYRFAGGRV